MHFLPQCSHSAKIWRFEKYEGHKRDSFMLLFLLDCVAMANLTYLLRRINLTYLWKRINDLFVKKDKYIPVYVWCGGYQ